METELSELSELTRQVLNNYAYADVLDGNGPTYEGSKDDSDGPKKYQYYMSCYRYWSNIKNSQHEVGDWDDV